MKKPLNIISEFFGTFTPKILEAATLDFCYDHVDEDYTQQDVVRLVQYNDFETLGIQDVE